METPWVRERGLLESAATWDVLGYQRSQLEVTMKYCAHMLSQKIKELVHQPY